MVDIWNQYSHLYLEGLWLTIRLALGTFLLAFLLGAVIAACRVSPVGPLNRFGAFYVATFRNTPLAVLLILAFFGLPKAGFRFDDPSLTWGVIVLSAYTGAYLAEAMRSGINSVEAGQAEAARAIGMGFGQLLLIIILPQAIRTVVGPISSLFIANFKNTAVLAVISVFELTKWSQEISNRSASPIEGLGIAALFYVAILVPTGIVFNRLDRRVSFQR